LLEVFRAYLPEECLCRPLILLLALTAGLVFNTLRDDGLSLLGAGQSALDPDVPPGEISLKDATLLYASGRALFLDARSQWEYEAGHIQGALLLPPSDFEYSFPDLRERLKEVETLITYCDGERCPLSRELTESFRQGVRQRLCPEERLGPLAERKAAHGPFRPGCPLRPQRKDLCGGLRPMKYAATITRLLLGALFVAASWDKLLHPAEFASIIRDYRLLPEPIVPALAVLLPWIELVVGGLLLVGYLPFGALFLANSMLASSGQPWSSRPCAASTSIAAAFPSLPSHSGAWAGTSCATGVRAPRN
jgi:hypothetical protein